MQSQTHIRRDEEFMLRTKSTPNSLSLSYLPLKLLVGWSRLTCVSEVKHYQELCCFK